MRRCRTMASDPHQRSATTCGCSANCWAKRCGAQEGEALYERVERVRALAKRDARRRLGRRLRGAGRRAARDAGRRRRCPSRAQLRALPEPRQRRRAASPRAAAPRATSAILAAVRSRRRSRKRCRGWSRPASRRTRCIEAVCGLRIELVVTAHPTEIMRRTLQHKYNRIADALAGRDRPDLTPTRARDAARVAAPRDRRRLAHRGSPARAAVAARRSPLGAGGVRGDAVGRRAAVLSDRSIAPCAGVTGRGLPLDAAPIRFGSWIGGDRDGNPSSPRTSRGARA